MQRRSDRGPCPLPLVEARWSLSALNLGPAASLAYYYWPSGGGRLIGQQAVRPRRGGPRGWRAPWGQRATLRGCQELLCASVACARRRAGGTSVCVRLQGIASGWPLVSTPRPAMVVCLAVAVPGCWCSCQCQCLSGESDPSRAACGQGLRVASSMIDCGLDATGYTKIPYHRIGGMYSTTPDLMQVSTLATWTLCRLCMDDDGSQDQVC